MYVCMLFMYVCMYGGHSVYVLIQNYMTISVRCQRRMDMLLLHVTKIIDLGRAGGGYNCFYVWYAIIGSTKPLKVL